MRKNVSQTPVTTAVRGRLGCKCWGTVEWPPSGGLPRRAEDLDVNRNGRVGAPRRALLLKSTRHHFLSAERQSVADCSLALALALASAALTSAARCVPLRLRPAGAQRLRQRVRQRQDGRRLRVRHHMHPCADHGANHTPVCKAPATPSRRLTIWAPLSSYNYNCMPLISAVGDNRSGRLVLNSRLFRAAGRFILARQLGRAVRELPGQLTGVFGLLLKQREP